MRKYEVMTGDARKAPATNTVNDHCYALIAHLCKIGVLKNGMVISGNCYHDVWCASQNNGECNCDPILIVNGKEYQYSKIVRLN
jgi:hypothetical protein